MSNSKFHRVCLILVRYPASQNCEGEKHQPGFVSPRPASTEACWNGGEGDQIYSHYCTFFGSMTRNILVAYTCVGHPLFLPLLDWLKWSQVGGSFYFLMYSIFNNEILNMCPGIVESVHPAFCACISRKMFYSGFWRQQSFLLVHILLHWPRYVRLRTLHRTLSFTLAWVFSLTKQGTLYKVFTDCVTTWTSWGVHDMIALENHKKPQIPLKPRRN